MITEITLKVPKEMSELMAETSQTLYFEAIKEVVAKRLADTQKRLQRIQENMRQYEIKYHLPYEAFSEHVPDTMEAHDDWIAWAYLVKAANELAHKEERIF